MLSGSLKIMLQRPEAYWYGSSHRPTPAIKINNTQNNTEDSSGTHITTTGKRTLNTAAAQPPWN